MPGAGLGAAADRVHPQLGGQVGQANGADLDEVRARTAAKMPQSTTVAAPTDTSANGDTPADESPDVIHAAQLGMAVKLGKLFAGKLIHVNGIGWHSWDGKRWAPDNSGAARRAVHTLIKHERAKIAKLPIPSEENEEKEKRYRQITRYENASAITGILTEAAALLVFSTGVSEIDVDPYLLNCANGTLDLRTMQLRPHNPDDRITKITRAAHDPNAAGPVWARFIAMALPGEDIRAYLQRVIGVALCCGQQIGSSDQRPDKIIAKYDKGEDELEFRSLISVARVNCGAFVT